MHYSTARVSGMEGWREVGRKGGKKGGTRGGRKGGREGGREHRSEGRAYKCLVQAAGAMYAHNRQLHAVYTRPSVSTPVCQYQVLMAS